MVSGMDMDILVVMGRLQRKREYKPGITPRFSDVLTLIRMMMVIMIAKPGFLLVMLVVSVSIHVRVGMGMGMGMGLCRFGR